MGPIARILYFRFSPSRIVDATVRFVILTALAVTAALATGRLFIDEWAVLSCDAARALPLVSPEQPGCPDYAAFPLVRDYASLFHLVMIAVLGSYGSALIDGLERFWTSALQTPNLLQPTSRERAWLPWVGNARRTLLGDVTALVIGGVMCYVGLLGYESNGIYPAFALTSPMNEFAVTAAANSWSAFPGLGYFAFLVVGTIGNYYIVHIGFAATVSLFVAGRASLGHRLGLDSFSPLPKWGWGPAFDAVSNGVVTTVFGLLGLLALVLRGGFVNLPYLLAFPVVAVLAIVPWLVVNRIWQRTVDDARERLAVVVAAAGPTRNARIEHVAYTGVLTAPPRIVSTAATLFQLVFTVVPGLITLAQVMTAVDGGSQ